MDYSDMGNSEWRSSTRRLHEPGGSSNMGSVLGFGYNTEKDGNNINNNNNNNNNLSSDKVVDQCKDEKSDERILGNNNNVNINNIIGSDAEKVREFTFEAGQSTPLKPTYPMDNSEVKFIGKMILDELLELFSTVMKPEDAKFELKNMIDNAKSIEKMNVGPNEQHKLIAEQADAFVDIWYYSLNAACKKGINCSKIFEIVHNANMAKRDPITKKFIKREDGKIIKPKGWKPPNVENEILRQMHHGAWTNDGNNNNK